MCCSCTFPGLLFQKQSLIHIFFLRNILFLIIFKQAVYIATKIRFYQVIKANLYNSLNKNMTKPTNLGVIETTKMNDRVKQRTKYHKKKRRGFIGFNVQMHENACNVSACESNDRNILSASAKKVKVIIKVSNQKSKKVLVT